MWLETGTQLVIGTSCVPVSALASRFGTMRMESPKLRYAEPNGLREHITRTGVSDLVFTYWGVRTGVSDLVFGFFPFSRSLQRALLGRCLDVNRSNARPS